MGERAITEIARRLNDGQKIEQLAGIAGTAYVVKRDVAVPARVAAVIAAPVAGSVVMIPAVILLQVQMGVAPVGMMVLTTIQLIVLLLIIQVLEMRALRMTFVMVHAVTIRGL